MASKNDLVRGTYMVDVILVMDSDINTMLISFRIHMKIKITSSRANRSITFSIQFVPSRAQAGTSIGCLRQLYLNKELLLDTGQLHRSIVETGHDILVHLAYQYAANIFLAL